MRLLSHFIEHKQNLHEITNWKNFEVSDGIMYSSRDTVYTEKTFPSSLHYHDYYEMVVFEQGDIRYICESSVFYPEYSSVIIIPPSKLHTSKINCSNARYKRHVLYFYPQALKIFGNDSLYEFINKIKDVTTFAFSSKDEKERFLSIFSNMGQALVDNSDDFQKIYGLGSVAQAFYFLKVYGKNVDERKKYLPDKLLKVQRFIDENICEVTSVTEIASHFFYSREYLSRSFKKYFNTTITDYINKRRVAKSQQLLSNNFSVTEVCFSVGYGSLSTFIRIFKSITGVSPSKYRQLIKK